MRVLQCNNEAAIEKGREQVPRQQNKVAGRHIGCKLEGETAAANPQHQTIRFGINISMLVARGC